MSLRRNRFVDSAFTIFDNGDTTKNIAFEASGITTATTRTITMIDEDLTIVGLTNSQTLTNKTLTTPTIGSFTNATHNHQSAAGGGLLDLASIDTTAWSSWTPTWTNLTIGNGTNSWKYRQIGKSVFFRGVTIFGTTTTMGTGPTFTLPTTSVAVPNTNMQICTLKLYNGSGNWNGEGNWATTTTCLLQYWDSNNNTGGITSTVPGTWATNWGVFAQGFYETA